MGADRIRNVAGNRVGRGSPQTHGASIPAIEEPLDQRLNPVVAAVLTPVGPGQFVPESLRRCAPPPLPADHANEVDAVIMGRAGLFRQVENLLGIFCPCP